MGWARAGRAGLTWTAVALAGLCTALNAGCPERGPAEPSAVERPVAAGPRAKAGAGAASSPSLPDIPQPPLPFTSLIINGKLIQAEVADEEGERNRGLMQRRGLAPDQGMLFVYPGERALSFWMKDTIIPLSIAYINAAGLIISIKDLQPLDQRSVSSDGLARFALEMDQGWFAQNGIQVGAVVEGLPVEGRD